MSASAIATATSTTDTLRIERGSLILGHGMWEGRESQENN